MVTAVRLNGTPLPATLQLPERQLRTGCNTVEVERGDHHAGFRLYGSSVMLLDVVEDADTITYTMRAPVDGDLIVDGADTVSHIRLVFADGRACPVEVEPIGDSGKSRIAAPGWGDCVMVVNK